MIDLYFLLRSYAANTKSATINIRQFLDFARQYAAQKQHEHPELVIWISNAEAEFQRKITELVVNGRCLLLADSKDENVFLPDFCREIIKSTYQNSDRHADIPFLSAVNMNLKIPGACVKTISLLSDDMKPFFGHNSSGADSGSAKINPNEIIELQFPQNYGSALMLGSMIPHKLMELALLKVHSFLERENNVTHIQNTLNVHIKGKERNINDCMDRILNRPLDCLKDIEHFGDFSYMFWVHFCSLIKNDIKSKEIRAEDLAVLQAAYVIEVCSNLYRSSEVKKRDIDAAFTRLEELMNLPPYRYTLGDIIKFTNNQGIPLLNFYSKKELEAYIRKAISEGKKGELPPWISIQGIIDERSFFRKEHYLPVCIKILGDVQPQVKAALIKRWSKLIQDYLSEPAMEKDPEYEKLLKKLTNNITPILQTMLEDPKLRWAYQEYENSQGTVPAHMRLFNRDTLHPFYILYALRRRDVIAEIKAQLPVWYSIPVLLSIIKFFKTLGRKKGPQSSEDDEKPAAAGKKPDKMRNSALKIKSDIVPEGKTVDEYLALLEERWCGLRAGDTRKNMIVDVKALLKDKLRKTIALKRMTSIKRDELREIADYLIKQNQAMAKLNDQESLRTYMELYMLKLLLR